MPSNEFPVLDIRQGKVEFATCCEAYMPEVSRALVLRGAEMMFIPVGTTKGKPWASWRNLIWSRAIENLTVVVTPQNLFSHAERGLAMVAKPEEILFESTATGFYVINVSLERARNARHVRQRHHVAELRRQVGRPRPAMATAGIACGDLFGSEIAGSTSHNALRQSGGHAIFLTACPLDSTSVRSRASAMSTAASSAPPSAVPAASLRWRPHPAPPPM